MLTKRHAKIIRLLESEGMASIAALADLLGVSQETVRRDVRPLTETGSLVRIHGAVALAGHAGEAPFQRRMRENAAAKQAIARATAASIRDGDSLMVDTGTTTSFLARALVGRRNLTVVTNSSDIARTLSAVNGNRVYMAGGEMRGDSGATFGKAAIDHLGRFSVRHVILSAGAVGAGGIMDYELEEAEFARAMLGRGEQRVVVTDHSKFSRRGFVSVCGFDQVDVVVTDAEPPKDIALAMREAGTALTLA